MNQEALAEVSGIAQSRIADYETAEAQPDFATVQTIAGVLNVSPAWVAFGIGSRQPSEDDAKIIEGLRLYKNDDAFLQTLVQTGTMLSEEGLESDLGFLFLMAAKLGERAKTMPDNIEIGERITKAVEDERLELRKGLDDFRKSRL